MKSLLLLPLLVLPAAGEDEDRLKTADLKKLADPATRAEEVAKLADCDGKKRFLTDYRLHDAPAADGKESLTVLTAGYDHDFERRLPSYLSGYETKDPEDLFGIKKDSRFASLRSSILKPELSLIEDHALLVFDAEGNEIRPFDGNNFISTGYLYDFNRDGVLKRADHTNHGVKAAPDDDIQVFNLVTVERKPRTLLSVAYNWHPDTAADANEWGFTCFDEEGDGIVEIAFGPKYAASEKEQRQFVFRWNADTRSYSAGLIHPRSHIRVLHPDEDLEALAKAGGLNYELIGESPDSSPDEKPRPSQAPYAFKSLKDSGDGELFAFFRGKERKDFFDEPDDGVPNQLPDGFWKMTPKEAALAFVEANRTPSHRTTWMLAIDDRDGIAPPKSGWFVHDWTSSGCYSLSTHLFALRFGKEKSWLLATDYNSNGVVGANPLADQPGYSARVIPLEGNEASFLAETLFWLDRVRAYAPAGGKNDRSSGGSTADGHASLHLLTSGSTPRKIGSETVWAGGSISGRWNGAYSTEICINLAEYLLDTALSEHLGPRWQVGPEIDRRSLATPLEDRLKPRLDDDARARLAANIRDAFARHWADPLPATALAELVRSIGEEALVDLLPELERLQSSLDKANAEDAEFEALRKRFSFDHFGNAERDEPTDHPKDYERYKTLMDKRAMDPGPVLRDPLADSIKRLQIAGDQKRLVKEADGNGPSARWALDRLRKSYPLAWEDFLILRFRDGNLEDRRNLFATLAAARPEAAKNLVVLLSPQETADLLNEVVKFETTADPERVLTRVPALIDLVRDRKGDFIRRGEAMQLLGNLKLTEEHVKEFRPLLLAELKNPQHYKDMPGMNTISPAVDALSRLPGAEQDLDAIVDMDRASRSGFETSLETTIRLTEKRPDRKPRLTALIKPCFKSHPGMMNDVFIAALALDLEALAPDIAAFASESPTMEDGDGANYSGGHFKGPAGERYHIAREITALWNEKDPATLARMWIAFVANRPGDFGEYQRDAAVAKFLREKAATAIGQLPPEERQKQIDAVLSTLPKGYKRESAEKVLSSIETMVAAK